MVMFGNVSNYLLESFDVFIRIGLLDIGILEILQKAYEKLSRGVI